MSEGWSHLEGTKSYCLAAHSDVIFACKGLGVLTFGILLLSRDNTITCHGNNQGARIFIPELNGYCSSSVSFLAVHQSSTYPLAISSYSCHESQFLQFFLPVQVFSCWSLPPLCYYLITIVLCFLLKSISSLLDLLVSFGVPRRLWLKC